MTHMKLSALLAPLVAANVSAEVILQTVLAYEQQQADALEHRRQVDAERQARKRERDKSRDVTLRHSDRPLVRDRVAGVEDNNSTTQIEPQSKKHTPSDVAEFKSALSGVCDPERIEAIVKHRRTKRGQITGHAARLFVADAAAAGLTVPQAVDTCISRNWITVKADWLDKGQARGSPPSKPPSVQDVARNLRLEMEQADEDPSSQTETDRALIVSFPGRQYG